MPECIIEGVPVNFPFVPYDLQKAYMAKVIRCLEDCTNGVLESPTGTGKTLSLLCSTLAWILQKKAQAHANQKEMNNKMPDVLQKCNECQPIEIEPVSSSSNTLPDLDFLTEFNKLIAPKPDSQWDVPKVIYASRTHSQLTQAMQELKRSSYSFMRAIVLGSRDQLCIHPEVSKENNNAAKVQLCKLRVVTRTCSFYSNVERQKDNPEFREQPIRDIEDLIAVGRKLKMCPYYGSKELVEDADIVFMPYNYLLDPKARKANKVDLKNTIIILDEAHNVEKVCEEAASIVIKSSDIAMAIEEVTHVMKGMSANDGHDTNEDAKDFTLDDLAQLKEMILDLEKAVDEIEIATYPGEFMLDLLAKAKLTYGSQIVVLRLLDSVIQYLVTMSEKNSVFTKGGSLQLLSDLLTIVFSTKEEEARQTIKKCFKVHVEGEEVQTNQNKTKNTWLSTRGPSAMLRSKAKIINYWCFTPSYGMSQLLNKNVRSVILTSGTLAPLKPLIAELGITIAESLENPHIVTESQVCVKIVSSGPDKESLVSNFANRDNPKYLASLGRTVLSFCPVIPGGLLIFFPSYPLMNKCIDNWQVTGIWNQISKQKAIFVEPRGKDAFLETMSDYYRKINDPSLKGACFMAVCRGKVSEGLDFADINGRAVMITGLPFPPLKDPKVILKKQYLEENRTKENEFLSGNAWYSLEATRAVNQAIGRVIRHKDDYGAILLCDARFNTSSQKSQLSTWIQGHLNPSKQHTNFGPLIGEVSRFFRNAGRMLPVPQLRDVKSLDYNLAQSKPKLELKDLTGCDQSSRIKKEDLSKLENKINIGKANEVNTFNPDVYSLKGTEREKLSATDFMSRLDSNVTSIDFNAATNSHDSKSLVTIHKRERTSPLASLAAFSNENSAIKKRKIKLVSINQETAACGSNSSVTKPNREKSMEDPSVPVDRSELLKLIKNSVPLDKYNVFITAIMSYQTDDNVDKLFQSLLNVFSHPSLYYLIKAMRRFIKDPHLTNFDEFIVQHLS